MPAFAVSRKTLLASLIISGALAFAAPSSWATTYVRLSDAALVDLSALVVVGRVSAVQVEPTLGLTTDYTVVVERVLKGAFGGSEVTVHVPGGRLPDGRGRHVFGAPTFAISERVLLFLEPRDDGRFGATQLFMGAFHEVGATGASQAVRDLSETSEQTAAGLQQGADDVARDFEDFANWIAARAVSPDAEPRYWLPVGTPVAKVSAPFTLFSTPARRFEFDVPSSVTWLAHQSGMTGMPGGGFNEFQQALAAWTDDAGSNISLQYGGTTTAGTGFSANDGVNVVLWNDPLNEISGSFSCSSGGVLAIGGYSYSGFGTYRGVTYGRIVEGDIVTQDNAACFFMGNGGLDGAEVLSHELGHTLGFAHSCGDAASGTCTGFPDKNDALMRASAHGGGRGAGLRTDDKAGAATLYLAAAPAPSISINDVSLAEGNSGSKNFVFTVSLSAISSQAVTMSAATANGSALVGSDYLGTSGVLTIPAGSTTATITVVVLGDTIFESNETFSVNLTNAANATFADAVGLGAIQNDDAGKTACASGCDFTTIQAAINAAGAGGSVLVKSTYDSIGSGEVFPIQTLAINEAGSVTVSGETDASGNPTTTVKTRSGPVDAFIFVSPGSVLQDIKIVPGDSTKVNRVVAAARNPGSCPGPTCHLNGLTLRNVVIDFTVISGTSTPHFNTANGLDLLADNVTIDKVKIKGIATNSIFVDGDNYTIKNSTLDGRDPANGNAIRGVLAVGFGADERLTGVACSGFPSNYLIDGNTITGYANGIQWCSGRNNTVSNNAINEISGTGIDASGSFGTQIFGNSLQQTGTGGTHGIGLSDNAFQTCTGNTIRNNKVYGRAARDLQRGITTQNCLETIIFQNEVRNFADSGGAIYVVMASGVATKTTIQGNTVIGGDGAGIVYEGADAGATAVDQSVIRDNVVNEFKRDGIVVKYIKGVRTGAGAGNVVAYNAVRAVNQGNFATTHAFNLQNLANTAFDRNSALDTRGSAGSTGFGFFLANSTGVNGNCNTGSTNDGGLFSQVSVTPAYGNANVNCRAALYSHYDFDGDGKSDVTMYRHTTGQWFIHQSSNGGDAVIPFGNPGPDDIPAPGNYTVAGKTDLAIYRYTTGQWYIRRATDGGTTMIPFGSPLVGDVPMPADYDGDGITDLAVFRVSTANAEWYIRRSSDGQTQYVAWGCAACADLGVPGDYDGDGKADVAVYRRSTGEWFIRKSSDTNLQQVAYGSVAQGDIPVPGRYTQAGKTDMAVYRSLTGEWFIRRSTDFGTTSVAFGSPAAGDFPVSADFTTAGITDIAVYRPTPPTAQFMIRRSTDFSTLILPYGDPGSQDAPLTAR